ncbi:MAG: IS630 family transposase, partial [Planctomycetia bacterium]
MAARAAWSETLEAAEQAASVPAEPVPAEPTAAEPSGGRRRGRRVWLDETGLQTNMTRSYGRGPRGKRVVGRAPKNWKSLTLAGAMTADGMLAGLVFEGAMDGAAFEVFVARELAPQLRPGDVVVWDNLAVHKSAAARRLIEAAGAAIAWLPAYSPDLNRI